MPDQSINNALQAAIAGTTLGSPHIGRTQAQRLVGYSPIPNRMAAHPALDCWLIWLKAHQESRPAESLGPLFLDRFDDNTEETAYGLMNLRRGFGSPMSGLLDNPLHLGSRAVLRSLIWGLLHHGDPTRAATYAFFDASIDHNGDGAHIPATLAYALAASYPGTTAQEFWSHIDSVLPASSALRPMAMQIIERAGHPEATQEFANQFETRFPLIDPNSAAATAAFALAGLFNSGSNAESAMLLSAGMGRQSDLAAGIAGMIGAFLWGPIPPDYINTLDSAFIATHALRHTDPPATIADFINALIESCPSLQDPAEVIAEPELATEEATAEPTTETPPTSEPKRGPILDPTPVQALLASSSLQTSVIAGSLQVTAEYFDPPIAAPPARKLQIKLKSLSDQVQNLSLALSGPAGWQVASRIADAALYPGQELSFPAVIQPSPAPGPDNQLRFQASNLQILIPFIAPQRYHALGPFVNIEGTGFTYEHPPEKVGTAIQSMAQPFAGRSDLGIRWQQRSYAGVLFDVEPEFRDGPGVVYLYARATLPTSGLIRFQAAFAGGLKLWVDRNLILSYNDVRIYPSSHPHYQAQAEVETECRILIKLVRGRDPVLPLSLTLFDESGRLIFPLDFTVDP